MQSNVKRTTDVYDEEIQKKEEVQKRKRYKKGSVLYI